MTSGVLKVPAELDGLGIVASVSGGKDSTAMLLALRDAEIPHRAVFADTGWESDITYRYLDYLREALRLDIEVVADPLGMVGRSRERKGFPARMQRWCTRLLKILPIKRYRLELEERSGVEQALVVGIRADESAKRATMPEVEDDDQGGGWVWRPMLRWTVEDVLTLHNRHGVKVNPIYQLGSDRVGCWPCIYATKDQIRILSEIDPTRVELIRELEREITRVREANGKPGQVTFFQVRHGIAPMTIDDIALWAKTSHGGRQFDLFGAAPRGGCMRWGMCDLPAHPIVEPDDE
jgi:3'-phosphoadenosine 5'-phosphosulfate sulfotransferase (PAPS reductase)/FAD synthetase